MPAHDTQEKVLDAAERLFAEHGFASTSLRKVTSEAGVNLAAVHYHFGSKAALVRAVFARRLDPLNAERLRALDAVLADSPGGGAAVETILETLVRPLVDLSQREPDGAQTLIALLGRVHAETASDLQQAVEEQFADVAKRYLEALAHALPVLDRDELCARFHFVIGTMASSLADPRRLAYLSGRGREAHGLDDIAAQLVAFVSAGMAAPARDACDHDDPDTGSSDERAGGAAS